MHWGGDGPYVFQSEPALLTRLLTSSSILGMPSANSRTPIADNCSSM